MLQRAGLVWLMVAGACFAADTPMALPLEDVVALEDQSLGFEQSVELMLPALPSKPGKAIVLRCRMVSWSPRPSGCNYNARLTLSGTKLGRYTAAGNERLIGRRPSFEFVDQYRGAFPVFGGSDIMVLFAPDVDSGDAMITDGLGATFVLDITDVVAGVDGNTLTIDNIRVRSALADRYDLIVREIEVGYIDRDLLPKPLSRVPTRGAIAASISADDWTVRQGTGGGFAVSGPGGVELLVETAVSMDREAASVLVADDTANGAVQIEPWGEAASPSYRVVGDFDALRMERTVSIENGAVTWRETWINTGDAIRGVPLRHRLFQREGGGRFILSGDPDAEALDGAAVNPTLFLQTDGGNGIGVTAENDVLRLVMSLLALGDVGEIYSQQLALAPGKRMDLRWTIDAVDDGGGYWSFINHVRRRWGVNRTTVERPLFWGYNRDATLSDLGPIDVIIGPWMRLEPDARTVTAGRYPKLPDSDEPDIDGFLTFEHRQVHRQQLIEEVKRLHDTCPNARVLQMMHPAMEAVYKPQRHRWPIDADVILTAEGEPFEAGQYSRAWVGDYVNKGWAVFYYVPRPGSTYLQWLLDAVRFAMDEAHLDGVYSDEFSWAGRRRAYSRYDYGRWDGFSADLDSDGNVVRLKSDNAFVSESAQLQLAHEVLSRGGMFMVNSSASLRSVNDLPIAHFVEGGNGYGHMSSAHLAPVPLVLGNYGEQTTTQGIFEAVKTALSMGCVYSPLAINHLIDGPDNFVCKLYPITVRELHKDTIIGDERLITTRSGAFAWPEKSASVRLYLYDAAGSLIDNAPNVVVAADGLLTVDVPENGLAIAELEPRGSKEQ
jgi:hypothetical protein